MAYSFIRYQAGNSIDDKSIVFHSMLKMMNHVYKWGVYKFNKKVSGSHTLGDFFKKLKFEEIIHREQYPITFRKLYDSQALVGVPVAFVVIKAKRFEVAYITNNENVWHSNNYILGSRPSIIAIWVPKKYHDRVSKKLQVVKKVSTQVELKLLPKEIGKGPCAPFAMSILFKRKFSEIVKILDEKYNDSTSHKLRRGHTPSSVDGTSREKVIACMKDAGYEYIDFWISGLWGEIGKFSISTLVNKGELNINKALLAFSKHVAAFHKGIVHDTWDSRRHRLDGIFFREKDRRKVEKAIEKLKQVKKAEAQRKRDRAMAKYGLHRNSDGDYT